LPGAWKDIFQQLQNELIEITGMPGLIDISSIADQSALYSQINLPDFNFSINGSSLSINYINLSSLTINLYLIDLEIIFSDSPFLDLDFTEFSFVLSAFTTTLSLTNSQSYQTYIYNLPAQFSNLNLYVEVSSSSKDLFQVYSPSSMIIVITEALGEITVLDSTKKPLKMTYIKVYAQMKDGSIQFYKDGFTDLRGKFNYLELNTNQLPQVDTVSILIINNTYGTQIRKAKMPALIKGPNGQPMPLDYSSLKNQEQSLIDKWRAQNNIN